jgi:hypothetical protein
VLAVQPGIALSDLTRFVRRLFPSNPETGAALPPPEVGDA